ncbi:MAG: hypothetical protein PUB14_05460, partial [Lachnospiraceae bacterium]|nr:hypothetical protein [Lachnospiraceae bacterium]
MLQKKAKTIIQWLFALSIILCSGSMLGVLYGDGSLGLSDFKLRVISILITGVYVLLDIKKI